MALARTTPAKSQLIRFFTNSPERIHRQRDLARLLEANRTRWRVPDAMGLNEFIVYLTRATDLRRVHLKLPHRPETRYVWGKVPNVVLALSIKPGSYLTHFSAMWVHELTSQVPKTVYVNVEQRAQISNPGSLTQEGIDRAFRNQQRMTTNIAEYQGVRLVYLNGKFTGQLGVVDHRLPGGEVVRVTDVERTLIDAAVRPAYSGGVSHVAAAYAAAVGRLSVNKLAALLTKMEYVYPYEQAVGFYLQRAGAKPSLLRLFQRKPFRFDFYLAHGMKATDYVPGWRLHVPKGF